MNYTMILVPIDFSDTCTLAATRAAEIKNASTIDCRVALLHVVDYMPPAHLQVELPESLSSAPRVLADAETRLAKLKDEAGLVDADLIVQIGHPREVIKEVQKNLGADLIIMAKHSRRGLERMLGSVTNGVANNTDCELLVLPV